MAPLPKRLKELCNPALFYFIISVIALVVSALQNVGRRNTYVLGGLTRRVPNTSLVFLVKIVYILFWTWILNLICKDGHTTISWLLVLAPFILLFAVVFLMMVSPYIEGMETKMPPSTAATVALPPTATVKDKKTVEATAVKEGFAARKKPMKKK
uniref:Transmembrane protein n=1 Tax=viral metagenome TaxID=1070528 RepID=A0A6C0KUZ7_9ZZZZ